MDEIGDTRTWTPSRLRTGAAHQTFSIAPGTLVAGRYVVHRKIGSGGYGLVCEARDTSLQTRVALKFIRRELIREDAVDRMRREAVSGRRAPAGFARIHHFDWWAGIPFLVMDLVEGESLKSRLHRAGPLPIDEVIPLGAQLARSLARLHELGMVHRDVKPGNVIIATDATPTLCDLGLAKALDEATLTATGLAVGTPGYIAPEILSGQEITDRADVYGLARTLEACLVLPAEGATRFESLVPDSRRQDLEPRVPRWLRRLLRRALDPQAARRPSAAAIAQALERRRFRAWPVRQIAAAAVLIVPLGFGAALVRGHGKPESPPPIAAFEQLQGQLEPLAGPPVLSEMGQLALQALAGVPQADWGERERLAEVDALRLLGDAQRGRGLLRQSEEYYREALVRIAHWAATDSLTGDWCWRAWLVRAQLGRVAAEAGDTARAISILEHVRRGLQVAAPSAERPLRFRLLLSAVLCDLASAENTRRGASAAKGLYGEAAEACLASPSGAATLEEIICRARPLTYAAIGLQYEGRLEEGERTLEQADRLIEAALAAAPWDPRAVLALADSLRLRAFFHLESGDWSAGSELQGRAVAAVDQLLQRRPDDVALLSVLRKHVGQLRWIEATRGEASRANELLTREYQLAERLVTLDPGSPRNRTFLFASRNARAADRAAEGDLEGALQVIRAREGGLPQITDEMLASRELRRQLVFNLRNEARFLRSLGRFEEAAKSMDEAVSLSEALAVDGGPVARIDLAVSMAWAAFTQRHLGHVDQAARLTDRAAELVAPIVAGSPNWRVAGYTEAWVQAMCAMVSFDRAQPEAGRQAAARAQELVGRRVHDLNEASVFDLEVLLVTNAQLGRRHEAERIIDLLHQRRNLNGDLVAYARAQMNETASSASER